MKKLWGNGHVVFRALILLVVYSLGTYTSLWLGFMARFDFNPEPRYMEIFQQTVLWIVPLKLGMLALFGQFGGLLSYFSIPDLRRLFFAVVASSGLIMAAWIFSSGAMAPPRGVILADFVTTFLGLAAVRLGFRLLRENYLSPGARAPAVKAKRVAIIGAGDVGANLGRELLAKRGLGLNPVAFLDDDKAKWGMRIHGIPVIGSPETLNNPRINLELESAIIAMPSAPVKRLREIVEVLQKRRLKFQTVPSMDQLATGAVKVSQLREVEIQDLLGREAVELETDNIRGILAGRVIMVTGAGGSIGSELCRQIAAFNPKRLLLVDQSEVQLFPIEQELAERGYAGIILPVVADVLDHPRVEQVFKRHEPEVVFHAAAHKHVPMMENQPGEAIKNNTLGTATVARMALQSRVDRFVLISTDKAINPTSVMGATKRMAEIFVQALHAANPGTTKFMAVRFGNVLGSSGSVIPTFKKQIAAGGPVKVTHPEITRYFMTIPEAVGLVLQSGAQGSGGEIFVLDMGQPVKILDLARQLIELTGLRPDEDIAIEFTGLRPGEKLFEELSHSGENVKPTGHPKITRFVCAAEPLDRVETQLAHLATHAHTAEPGHLKVEIRKIVPEYTPYLD